MCPRSYQHRLHHVQVGHALVGQLGMLGQMHVLLGHHDALFEEELIDGDTVFLGHQHLITSGKRGLAFMSTTTTTLTINQQANIS